MASSPHVQELTTIWEGELFTTSHLWVGLRSAEVWRLRPAPLLLPAPGASIGGLGLPGSNSGAARLAPMAPGLVVALVLRMGGANGCRTGGLPRGSLSSGPAAGWRPGAAIGRPGWATRVAWVVIDEERQALGVAGVQHPQLLGFQPPDEAELVKFGVWHNALDDLESGGGKVKHVGELLL